MNQLDPIEELYDMYSEEENTPRIIEVKNKDVMNCLGQAFWYQKLAAVIDGRL